jgi:hypothetical protein
MKQSMKYYSTSSRMGLLLLISTVLLYCKPKDPEPSIMVRQADTDTLTIVQARAVKDASIPGQIYITDAGSEGVFRLDQADKSSPDNTGVILVTANGQRYKREYTGSARGAWFGINTADTDIGPELQAAVSATTDLTLADGVYTQTTEVRMKSNMAIRGNAGRVIINLPKSYVSLVSAVDANLPLENVLIDGLSWNVTSKEKGTYGVITIDGPTVSNFTVQNCNSNDAGAEASTNWLTLKVQAGKTASGVVVQNNTIQAKRMGVEIFNHDNYGIYAGKDIVVKGNNIHDCQFGISLSGPLDGLTVDNNYLKNCSLYGVEIAGAARNVKITNNKFEGRFDKFIEGSNDGSGPDKNGGSIVGGLVITNNTTIGVCTGGIQLFNAGAATFSKNTFSMTGRLELLSKSSSGGTYSENVIETTLDNAVMCDNAPDNTFSGNTISNRNCPANNATVRAYNSGATNISVSNNKLIKGAGGSYYKQELGATIKATQNFDEAGNPIP